MDLRTPANQAIFRVQVRGQASSTKLGRAALALATDNIFMAVTVECCVPAFS